MNNMPFSKEAAENIAGEVSITQTRKLKDRTTLTVYVVLFTALIFCSALLLSGFSGIGSGNARNFNNISDEADELVPMTYSASISTGSGTKMISMPAGSTVEEALNLNGIEYDSNDILSCEKTELVRDGMKIEITKVDVEYVSDIETVAYETEYKYVGYIPKGNVAVKTKGVDGTVCNYYEIEYRDGEYYSENIVKSETVSEAVNEIVEVGVGGSFVGADGETYNYSYYIDMVATAYYGSGYTKSGALVDLGMIAVDPRVVPLKTKVYLTGEYKDYGLVSCEDTGGFIKGNRIDIYMATLEDCCHFGRRNMRVYILEDQEMYNEIFWSGR